MFSVQKRRLCRELTAAFQYLKGAYKQENHFLHGLNNDRTRRNGFKLKERKCIYPE